MSAHGLPAAAPSDPLLRVGASDSLGDDRFVVVCSAQAAPVPVLLAHAVRQAGLVAAYEGYALPVDHRIVLNELGYRVVAGDRELELDDAELVLSVVCTEVTRRRGVLWELRHDVRVEADGHALGSGSARLRFLSPALYRFARGASGAESVRDAESSPSDPLPAPVTGAHAGCARDDDVLLAATERPDTWRLRVLPTRMRAFVEVVDHVPGLILAEAARQAVHARSAPAVVAVRRLTATFARYADPHRAALIRVVEEDSGGSRVLVTQADEEVFNARVEWSAPFRRAAPPGG